MGDVRGWCYTLNNYTQDDCDSIARWSCKYSIFGKEIGELGTPHLQGYVYFPNKKTLGGVRKLLPRAHWEIAKGSGAQNTEYCSKEGDVTVVGVMPLTPADGGAMEKDKWAAIVKLSEEGNWDVLKASYPQVYALHLNKLERVHAKRKIDLTTIDGELPHVWLWGGTGSGKSLRARTENPGAYIKDPTTVWWNDYDGEDVVIIDDFDKYQVSQAGDMKRWLDRYPFQAQIKCGQSLIRPRKIVVTSNYHPNEIWSDDITASCILRRCDCIHMGQLPDPMTAWVPTYRDVLPNKCF